MKIELVKGSIADEQVDVLINTTTKDLNLSSGPVTKAILKQGGDSIQQQCKANFPQGIQYGEICETDGGNLKSQQIYHSALPNWGGDAEQGLRTFIDACLTEADKCDYQSIAFPALGTGNLKYPPETVAKVFFEAVTDFMNNTPNITLTLVRIVIYPTDSKVIQAFIDVKKDYETSVEISSSLGLVSPPSPQPPALPPRPQSQPPATPSGNVVVITSLLTGDISQQTTDVIVNTTNPELKLDDGAVSKVILAAAGNDLQDECTKLHPSGVKVGDVAVTGGGNLSCKEVYHITLTDAWHTQQQEIEKNLKSVMLKCLTTANSAGHTSVSMPALGTGKLNYAPDRVAEIMYDVSLGFRSTGLNKVCFVVHSSSPNVIQAFENELAKRRQAKAAKSPTTATPSLARTIGQVSSVKISVVKGNIEDQKADAIVNSSTSDLNLSSGPLTKAVLKAAGSGIQEECKQQYPNGIKFGEIAVTSGGDLTAKLGIKQIYHTTLAKWEPNDPGVEKAFRELIHNCLKTACQNFHRIIAIPILGTGVLKYPPESVTRWVFESIRNFGTRNPACYLAEARIVVHPSDMKNIQALENFTPAGTRPRSMSAVEENLVCPPEWAQMTDDSFSEVFPILPGCQEYQTVQTRFAQSMGQHTIVAIERVQNRILYFQYILKKQNLDLSNPGHDNEKQLWHGTSEEATVSINLGGFNRSYSGKNATMYGEGVYFAYQSQYSAQDAYSVKDSQGHKRMYMAQVLTGQYTVGQRSMRKPPPKDPSRPHELYDSLVNDVNNPEIFVIFNDTQAYPSYLITFKN